MKYIELNNQTKAYVGGNKELVLESDFNFTGAEFLSIKIQENEVFFKVLAGNFKVYEFKMSNAKILDFEISKECSWFTDDEVISNILIAIENETIYSLAISIKGGRDCRFMCTGIELVGVEEFTQ